MRVTRCDLAKDPQGGCGIETGDADHKLFLHRCVARGHGESERVPPSREGCWTGRGFQRDDSGGDGLGAEMLLEQREREGQHTGVIDDEVRFGKLPDAWRGPERRGAYWAWALQDTSGESGEILPGFVGGLCG